MVRSTGLVRHKINPITKKRARTNAITHNIDWTTTFLEELSKYGLVYDACYAANISPSTAYDKRKKDLKFAAAWMEALHKSVETLEKEMYRRAVDGVQKPVFQGGQHVGDTTEYSDTLLIFALKGNAPEKYRERFEITGDPDRPIKIEYVNNWREPSYVKDITPIKK